jgi:hypothetical protein
MRAHDYKDREQAFVKHWFLKHYLQKLALKVAQFQPGTTLNYIDGFSGPWDAVTEDATDDRWAEGQGTDAEKKAWTSAALGTLTGRRPDALAAYTSKFWNGLRFLKR